MVDLQHLKEKPKATKYLQQEPIRHEQALLWIICSVEQGRDLINDAMILYKAKRYGSAFNLACLGLEELAKPKILLSYLIELKDSKNKQDVWNKYRKKLINHEYKLEHVFSSFLKPFMVDEVQVIYFQFRGKFF